MVSIKRLSEMPCIWCTERKECVEATFEDGLKGFLCRICFWRACKTRAQKAGGLTASRNDGKEPPR